MRLQVQGVFISVKCLHVCMFVGVYVYIQSSGPTLFEFLRGKE